MKQVMIALSVVGILLVESFAIADEGEPKTWAEEVERLEAELDAMLKPLDAADAMVLAVVRKEKTISTLNDRAPDKGELVRLDKLRFLSIAAPDCGQFMTPGDVVVFVRGINVDKLVPSKEVRYEGIWLVAEYLQYKTVGGATRSGAVVVHVDQTKQDAIVAKEKLLEGTRKSLTRLTIDGRRVSGMYHGVQKRDGLTDHIVFEERVGAPEWVPAFKLDRIDLGWIRTKLGGEELKVISPDDRRFVLAGHKCRPRKWSTADGKFSTEASYVSTAGSSIKLLRADNGKEISVDQSKLCDEDRAYLKAKDWKNEPLER